MSIIKGASVNRVVIGGVIAVATRAIFKPLSYLTACYLLNANAAQLREEANHINNKKKLAAELSYKASACQGCGSGSANLLYYLTLETAQQLDTCGSLHII